MGILLFLPLVVITFIAYIVLKPLSTRRTVGICAIGIALFTVAGFSGFMLGGVSRMYSMKVEIHNLLKNTTNALNTNCEEVATTYKDAQDRINSGTSLDKAMYYISQNLKSQN